MTRYQAFIEKDWENLGVAQVLVTRRREDGSADYALFTVDSFCLGVKDALAEMNLPETIVAEEGNERLPEDFRDPIHPACAKKLIEGAVAYAESLGFSPHRDFRKARKILGGIDASACPRDFTYGRDGRPAFFPSPDDSDERIQRVCSILEARFGPDGFDFEEYDEEDIDGIMARESLQEFFADEPDERPGFFVFCGALTALLLSPQPMSPTKVMDSLWGETKRDWQDADELGDFARDLSAYWDYLDLHIRAAAASTEADATILDIHRDDFPDTEQGGIGIILAHIEWAKGFGVILDDYPNISWTARSRPDLQRAWEVFDCWVDWENRKDRIAEIAQGPEPLGLDQAMMQIARVLLAMRPEPPSADSPF